jgi:hypothetical protein
MHMALDLFQSDEYRALIHDHLYNTLAFLLENGQDFAIAAEVEYMQIVPELPEEIIRHFGETALFVLAGYTFESAYIDKNNLYFEAGFGEENIGAHVLVPFLSIKQILVHEYPIALNIASPSSPQQEHNVSPEHSMNALLRNPENQKLINSAKR